MDGFKVVYKDSSGSVLETWFGQPFSSSAVSMDDDSFVRMIFSFSYPGCKVLSVSPCKLDS